MPDSGSVAVVGGAQPIRTLAMISSIAYSLANFRGPLIEALTRKGIRVYALAPDFDAKTQAAVRALGAEPVHIALERTGMRPLHDAVALVRLARLLKRLKPDAVFGYFVKPVIYGTLAARLAGIPARYALVAGLGYAYGEQGSIKQSLVRTGVSALYRLAFNSCDRVFFQNGDDIDLMVGAGLLDRAKAVRLNGTGVDLDRLRPAPPVEPPPTFLLMSRLLREKGICEYAEAARIVRRDHPEARFLLLGGLDPNPGGLSEQEVRAWADEGLIEWAGHVDDVRPALAAASVYVLPSYYREGVPRSTQEALAMAKPVITTDNVGCRETVIDGRNGFMIPVRDAAALAAAMRRFIESPNLIAEMGAESRRLAEERFDVHEINRRILDEMGLTEGQRIVAGSADHYTDSANPDGRHRKAS